MKTLLKRTGASALAAAVGLACTAQAAEKSTAGKKYGVGLYFFEDSATDPLEKEVHKNYQTSGIAQPPVVEEIDVLAAVRRKD